MTQSNHPSLNLPQGVAAGRQNAATGFSRAPNELSKRPVMNVALDPAFTLPVRTPASNYPYHRIEHWHAADGTAVTIRPIRASDAGLEAAFLANLSRESRYQRVLSARGLLPGELKRLTDIDYRREMALIATVWTEFGERQIGVTRYVKEAGGGADFAIVIDDRWQRRGLGEKLIRSLMADARDAGVTVLTGITLSTNEAMQQLARKLGIKLQRDPADATVTNLTAWL